MSLTLMKAWCFKIFLNFTFPQDLILIVNKPTNVTRNTSSAIDQTITSSVINSELKTGIIKTDISNHFHIFFIFKCIADSTETMEEFIYKWNYSGYSIETFKWKLHEVNWNEVKQTSNAKETYTKFSEIYTLCMKNVLLSSNLGWLKGKILSLG